MPSGGRSQRQLGARVRKLRLDKGLSQRDLADPLLTPSYLSLIESGKREPSNEALTHIAKRLGVDPTELRTGLSPMAEAELELKLAEARRLLHRGQRIASKELAEDVVAGAKKGGFARTEAGALCVLATIRQHADDHQGALELFQEAERLLANEPGHLRFEATVGVATSHKLLDDVHLAILVLERYLKELANDGYMGPVAHMRAYAALVGCYMTMGVRAKAEATAEEALRYAPLVDEPEHLACMHMNVAQALLERGRHQDALEATRRAEEYFAMLDWKLGASWAQSNSGIVLLRDGKLDEARTAFEGVVAKLEAIPGTEHDRASTLNELGMIERLAGDRAAATERLNQARKLLRNDGPPLLLAMNYREMGLVVKGQDDVAAEQELRIALELFRDASAHREAAETARQLADLLKAKGEAQAALEVLEEGLGQALAAD